MSKRVIECLEYIEINIDEVASYVGKQKLFRHPTNNLAIHLNVYKSSQEAKMQLQGLINEVKGCFDQMLAIKDKSIRDAIISSFMSNINDSDVGCMEVRLGPALKFFALYQSNGGCFSIDDLMRAYHETCKGQYSVQTMLGFFAEYVEHGLPIKTNENKLISLTWQLAFEYFKNTLYIDTIEKDWLNYGNTAKPNLIINEDKWHLYYFNNEAKASEYLSYVKSLLPSLANDLKKAEIKFDKMNENYYFKLTDKQHQLFDDKFNHPSSPPNPSHPPARKISPLSKMDVLIKSIRWDNSCFINEFIDGITADPSQTKVKPNLRRGAHKAWTVYASGIYKRGKDKPSPYGIANADELKQMKAERSSPQSVSFVTPDANTPLFGHKRRRRKIKLAGVIVDAKDAYVSRMLKYDGGTINRPYEFNSKKNAEDYFNKKVLGPNQVLYGDRDQLKQEMIKNPKKYTEFLARIRWLESSSAVGIFSDNFETRCVAQYYAQVIRRKLNKPADYYVPIVYYIAHHPNNWNEYIDEQQQDDKRQAEKIINDPALLAEAIYNDDMEFLLLLKDPLSALKTTYQGKTLYCLKNDIIKFKDNADYITAIHLVCNRGWVEVLDILCVCKPDLDINEDLGPEFLVKINILISACLLTVANIIVGGNTPISALEYGNSPLISAIQANRPEVVKYLLASNRIDPSTTNSLGNNALMFAAINGNVEIMKILLADKRISVSKLNFFDKSALDRAIAYQHAAVVTLLLEHDKSKLDIDEYKYLFKSAAATENLDIFLTIANSAVKKYIAELSARSSEYSSNVDFFAKLISYQGIGKTKKLSAAEKFLEIINGKKVDLNVNEFDALTDSRLGELSHEIITLLNKQFNIKITLEVNRPDVNNMNNI